MKRIIVIGNCGSGKSTFAKKLHKILEIELIHLDNLFWKPNWIETPRPEWIEIVQKTVKQESWIIDGNYNSTLIIRAERADTIIFFDFSRERCLLNALKRTTKGKLLKTKRDDIMRDCNEKYDLSFYKWIWNYNKNVRPEYLKYLEKLREDKKVFVFESYKETDEFLEKLEKEKL